jgi:hypothetical protein
MQQPGKQPFAFRLTGLRLLVGIIRPGPAARQQNPRHDGNAAQHAGSAHTTASWRSVHATSRNTAAIAHGLAIVSVHLAGQEKRLRCIGRAVYVARTCGANFAGCIDRSVWAKRFLDAVGTTASPPPASSW